MTFDNLSLHPKILQAVSDSGYSTATEIQLRVIPKVLKGFDLRASAQTGTGKTAAFLLPALDRLMTPPAKGGKGPRVLIVVPTRELAMQISTQAEKYSKYLHQIKTVSIWGGVPYHSQLKKLARPYDILIATPGRLIDLIERGKINFPRLEILILDEADRMLDMGFIEPVEQIVALTPSTRQTLLFSATLQGSVVKLSERLLNKPMEIIVRPSQEENNNIKQKLHYVDDLYHKNRILNHILKEDGVDYSIVFTSTKRHAAQLVEELRDDGFQAAALHGDMNQRQRTRTIGQLRDGKIRVLVATDVAARGIDILAITHVINFDLPHIVEDYVHRIGRTGRAGAQGTALSFVGGRDAHIVKKIEQFTGTQIDVCEIAGLEPRPKKAGFKPKGKTDNKRRFNSNKRGPNRRFKSGSKQVPGRGRRKRKTKQY